MKKACVFFADGTEEVEGLMVVDILRRAGAEVKTVSVMGRPWVLTSHGIEMKTDAVFEEMEFADEDLLVLPGGLPGTDYLGAHEGLCGELSRAFEEGRYIAAICAAPGVFAGLGLLNGKKATSHPCREELLKSSGAEYLEKAVVRDGNIITSRGLGTALSFSLELAGILEGKEAAEKIAEAVVCAEV